MTFELAGQVLAPAWPEVFHTTTLLGEMRKGPDDVQKGNHHNDDDDSAHIFLENKFMWKLAGTPGAKNLRSSELLGDLWAVSHILLMLSGETEDLGFVHVNYPDQNHFSHPYHHNHHHNHDHRNHHHHHHY